MERASAYQLPKDCLPEFLEADTGMSELDVQRAQEIAGTAGPLLVSKAAEIAEADTGRRTITPERRMERRQRMLENYDHFLDELQDGSQPVGDFTPLPHQPLIFNRIGGFAHSRPDQDGTLAGYIKGAPNIGKTVIEAISSRAFGIGEVVAADEPPLSALVLVPRKKILQQTAADDNRGFGKFAPELNVGRYFSQEKTISDVTVMTYQAFNAMSPQKRQELAGRVDLVFGDEVHRAYGEQTGTLFKEFIQGKLCICLTATPAYEELRDIETELGINHKIADIGFREAIEDGIANDAQIFLLASGAEVTITDRRGIVERDMASVRENPERNMLIVDFMRHMAEEGRSGIVKCIPGAKLQHAREIAALASAEIFTDPKTGDRRPMRVAAVGTFRTAQENEAILEAYSAGQLDALTFSNYLTEGYDEAMVEYVLSASPTSSRVDMDQLAGRGMRLKQRPTIYAQLIDRYIGVPTRIRTFFDTFEEEELKQGKVIRIRSARSTGDGGSKPQGDDEELEHRELSSASPRLQQALDSIAGKTLAELTIVGRRFEEIPEGWIPQNALSVNAHFSSPTIQKMLEKRGVERRQGRYAQWFVPPEAEALLADIDGEVASDKLVSLADMPLSQELFMRLTDDADLQLTRIWTRTDTTTKKPGWHLAADDYRRLQAYLKDEYPPVDPVVEITVPELAKRLGRHRTEIRVKVNRMNAKGSEIATYPKWTEKRKQTTCLSLADAALVAESFGVTLEQEAP